jgi:hypothetical protein
LDEHILGWYGLLLPVLLEIERYNKENKDDEISVYVKEKWGGLRIDISGGCSYLQNMAIRAEIESHKICQLCGAEGKPIWIGDWYWTLCNYHSEALKCTRHYDEKTRLLYIRNFMKPTGGINIKKPSCKECYNYKQTIQLGHKDHRFSWIHECTIFKSPLSIARKKCKGTYINIQPKRDMKVVKMISWEDAQNYPQWEDQNNNKDLWNCVKKFLVEKNIKFNGCWHQGWKYGVPLVEYGGKLYAFAVSRGWWGEMMADAFDPCNKDPLAYVDWAFQDPVGEQPTVDENKDPLSVAESSERKGM